MPPFRLLAVDVDGTISLPGDGVPSEVLAALRDCAAAGVLVVIATGKHPFLIRHIAAAISPPAPVIGCNGAITIVLNPSPEPGGLAAAVCRHEPQAPDDGVPLLHPSPLGEGGRRPSEGLRPTTSPTLNDSPKDRVIAAHFLPPDDYLALIKSLRHERRIQLAVFTDRDIVCTAPNFASTSLEAIGETTGRFLPDLAALAGEPIFKVLVASPDSSVIAFLRRELTPLWESQFSITTSGRTFLEFMAPGVSKGAALARLAANRGITRDQIIAIGDSENDLSMFAVAGFPVAVANAIPAVLQAARLIVPSAADRGVRYAIDQLILGAGA